MDNWEKLYKQDLEIVRNNIVSIDKLYRKSFLITGATGSVGSHLTDVLIYLNEKYNYGCRLFLCGRNIDKMRKRFGNREYLFFLPYDAAKEINFEVEADYCIHLAGNADPLKFKNNSIETTEANLLGVINILRYASKYIKEKMVYISTGEVYGIEKEKIENNMFAWNEKQSGYIDIKSVRSAYPISKRAAENLCMSYFEQLNFPVIVARLSHTFGSTFSKDDSRVHAVFMKRAIEKQDIILHTEGTQIRSYCYVSDSVSGILTLLTVGMSGEIYNISNVKNAISIRNFADKIASAAGVSVKTEGTNRNEKYDNKMNHAVLATDKMESIGWIAQFGIDEAIMRTIQILKLRNDLSG